MLVNQIFYFKRIELCPTEKGFFECLPKYLIRDAKIEKCKYKLKTHDNSTQRHMSYTKDKRTNNQ